MAKKNKNKIFEQQTEEEVVDAILEGVAASLTSDTKQISPNEKIVLTKDIDGSKHFDLAPDESKESIVENVPDDPTQMDMLNDKLNQISQLNAELNIARQKIAELENQIEHLQADNDALVMKLADAAAKITQTNVQDVTMCVQLPNGKKATVIGNPISKSPSSRVNYNNVNYSNNGYGTWN